MATVYRDNPQNFCAIEPYVLTDAGQAMRCLIQADRCFFYDACSFTKHLLMAHPEYLFEYIKRQGGLVVITRCILMELASVKGKLNEEYVEYIKKMNASGLKVCVLYEEDLFEVLSGCYSDNAKINSFLSLAVKIIKKPSSTIAVALEANKNLRNDLFRERNSDGTLFGRFFKAVRDNKESGDNLGEEMLAICIYLLANLPEDREYKYVVFTEDKGAIGKFNALEENLRRNQEMHAFSVLSTMKLVQCLFTESVISDKAQVEEVLSTGMDSDKIVVVAATRYDLEKEKKRMSCEELAEMIVTPNTIHIYY